MRWLIVVAFIGAFPLGSIAQTRENEKIIFLDKNGQPAAEKKAAFQQQIVQVDDTTWEYNFYRKNGPLIRSSQTSDAQGRVLNGRIIAYSPVGRPDTIGYYKRGVQTGDWSYYTSAGPLLLRRHYDDGVLIWAKDSATVRREADSAKAARLSLRIAGDTDAAFPGGDTAWLRYLNKTLRYPDDAVMNNIMGTVEVTFAVDTVGHIPEQSAWISRSVSLSIDQEALRIMRRSPAWTPAIYKGRLTWSYKRQPIVFKLETR